MIEHVWAVANSNFTTAFAGALAGALGAQIIFERASRRRELFSEIRHINTAIGLCNSIANAYLVFKKQIVRIVCDQYEKDKAQRALLEAGQRSGLVSEGEPFRQVLDLRAFTAPFSPIEALQDVFQQKISPSGPALSFLMLLSQAIQTLNEVLEARNELISLIRKLPPEARFERDAIYFGRPMGEITDGSYPTHMKTLGDLTDDCIGISIILERLLGAHGNKVVKSYGANAPKIAKAEWSLAEAEGLIPGLSRYEGWIDRSFGKNRDGEQL